MQTAQIQSPYLSYREAAEYCRVHPTTIWRAVKSGQLKQSGRGRAVKFHVEDLDAYMRGDGE